MMKEFKFKIMNPTNTTDGRPESFSTAMEQRLLRLADSLHDATAIVIKKGDDLMGPRRMSTIVLDVDKQCEDIHGPMGVKPCFIDRVNSLLINLENKVTELNQAALRIDSF